MSNWWHRSYTRRRPEEAARFVRVLPQEGLVDVLGLLGLAVALERLAVEEEEDGPCARSETDSSAAIASFGCSSRRLACA